MKRIKRGMRNMERWMMIVLYFLIKINFIFTIHIEILSEKDKKGNEEHGKVDDNGNLF